MDAKMMKFAKDVEIGAKILKLARKRELYPLGEMLTPSV
jgi:hypothetical protein